MPVSILLVSLLFLLPGVGYSQAGDGPYGNHYSVHRLADGVYTLTWALTPGAPAIGNATFIIGDVDVIVVDTALSRSGGRRCSGRFASSPTNPCRW